MPALPGPLRHAALPVVWAILPLTVGPALAAALADTSRPVQVTASAGAWAIWAATLVATLVPRTLSLTAIRIVGPAVLAAALWTAIDGVDATEAAIAAASAAVVTAIVMWPGTADRFVDGSSYGEERRFPLRPPGQLLLGPIELAWVVAVAGVVTGPLLLAAGTTVGGAVALVVGVPAARGGRQHHEQRREQEREGASSPRSASTSTRATRAPSSSGPAPATPARTCPACRW